jgi:hypothetical protein
VQLAGLFTAWQYEQERTNPNEAQSRSEVLVFDHPLAHFFFLRIHH